MTFSARRRFALSVVTLVLLACKDSKKSPATDTLSAMSADTGIRGDSLAATAADTSCMLVGSWTECKLLERLENSGLAPRRAQGTIRQPFLSIPGVVIALGDAELQAYLYPDTIALKRDYARMDTVRVAPPTATINWIKTPTLIRSNNLMAILLSNDETQVERVRNAIEAGLPAAPANPSGG
jgi:hypothetical protein